MANEKRKNSSTLKVYSKSGSQTNGKLHEGMGYTISMYVKPAINW